jgi:hypothetical protein
MIALGGAVLGGLVVGAGVWALSGGQAQGQALEAVTTRLEAISTRARAPLDRSSDALAQARAVPLFGASAQPVESRGDVAVQVFGIARSPARTAALLGIGGASAEWFSVGETRSGVTLRSVSASGAIVSTLLGERELLLGAASPGSPSTAGGPPASFKSPPPPASAPGMSP